MTDATFRETDHPRASNGQFGAGQVVATHYPKTGTVKVHGVHIDAGAAIKNQSAIIRQQYETATKGSGQEPYQNVIHAQEHLASEGNGFAARHKVDLPQGTSEVHLVTEGRNDGDFIVHGAHADAASAREHAERLSREVWEGGEGDFRSEVSDREAESAASEYNDGKPETDRVTDEEVADQSNPDFESFIEEKYPLDAPLPYPGLSRANAFHRDKAWIGGKHPTRIYTVSKHAVGADKSARSTTPSARQSLFSALSNTGSQVFSVKGSTILGKIIGSAAHDASVEDNQFATGGIVHVVTTAIDRRSEVRGVHDDASKASDHRDEIENDEGDDTAEHHEVELERSHDGPVDAVHVVHGPDGTGATSVYGAYDDYDAAWQNALAHSVSAWEAFGPNRGDLDRDGDEEDEAAQAWNKSHAEDHGRDHTAAFDEHFDGMFPSDERAVYPGFDAANEYFEGMGSPENVFRLHRHVVK